MPDIYLQKFLQAYPQYQGRFIAGPQPDQVYEHSIVMREDAPTALDEINAILAQLHHNGTFDRMMAPFIF